MEYLKKFQASSKVYINHTRKNLSIRGGLEIINLFNIIKRMNLYSVKSKLIILLVTSIMISTFSIGWFSFSSAKKALTESGMNDLSNIVNNSYNMAIALNEVVKSGGITKDEAQERMRSLLVGPKSSENTRDLSKNTIKVGRTGYIFAQDTKGILTMHPKLEGKSIWDVQGGVGKLIAETKNGVTRYAWENPGESKARYKITMLKYFEPWDWIIAVGSYEEEFYSAANQIKTRLYETLAIELVISLMLAWFMGNFLTKPLISIENVMKQLGQGNLKGRLDFSKRRDEYGLLAHHFNQSLDNLSEFIRKVFDMSIQVAASSEELTTSAEQTTKSTEQIASAIEQVASGAETQTTGAKESARAMEEMSIGLQRIAENCSIVSEASADSMKQAEEGGKTIQKNVQQMNSINRSVHDSDSTINQLYDRSQEIEKILDVITNIAKQTNLLALNAAIESARAGEHGRGFAVVADEVRKLAGQSSASTEQITNLIKEIQNDTERSVEVMGQVKREVQTGIEVAYETEQNFLRILERIKQIADQIQEVSAAAQQISAGSQEVTASISSIAQVSQETSASTQNVAASVEEQLALMQGMTSTSAILSKMAEELQAIIGKFKV
ncbi:MAG: methyl-accepting chemotaxis protein [Paenibacillaceae bacterium]